MAIILQILGVLFLLVVITLVGGFLLLRARFRKVMGSLAEMGEQMEYAETPARLNLVKQDSLDWKDGEKVDDLVTVLKGSGFTDAGLYSPEEMSFLKIHALAHELESAYAVVYEHPLAGVWFDVYCRYLDGCTTTYSTAPQGGEMDAPSNRTRVYDKDAPAGDFVRRFFSERRQDGLEAAPAAGFKAKFEKAYANEMDWRNARGGATVDEIRRSLTLSGEPFTEEQVLEIRETKLAQAMSDLDEGLRERFQRETTMSIPEWEEKNDRLVFIHDSLPLETACGRFYEYAQPETDFDDLPSHFRGLTSRAAFHGLNEEQPPDRRFEKVGELAEPVATDVYVAPLLPEEEDDDEDDE